MIKRPIIIALAAGLGSAAFAVEDASLPVEVVAHERKQPIPEAQMAAIESAAAEKEEAIRKSDRLWNLPYDVAYAYAHGKVAYEDLEFNQEDAVIYTDELREVLNPLVPVNQPVEGSRNKIRLVVITAALLFLVVGLILRKNKQD